MYELTFANTDDPGPGPPLLQLNFLFDRCSAPATFSTELLAPT